ncbi:amino acid ABC transporter permease/ATP-binding protein [Pannonibacter phragmitetus]|uniref:amino acid ABC transporter permease/ATP-binding protein n=1 Tax=Pannonibacter phragmitetus TaxID=121719 RepID=UPI000F013564|nr:amino acid ABC transporter permease/ATP-binding protein [Pannonibacter phragmitetus]
MTATDIGSLPRDTHTGSAAGLTVVPVRNYGRIAGTALSIVILGAVLNSILGNPRWGWPVFAEWFLAEPVLVGLGRTLLLTLLGSVFGFALGTVLALARVSSSPLLAATSWSFIWLFRSLPLIVLLLLLYNIGYLYERIVLGVPFTDITFYSWQTTNLITPFAAAVLGLSLNLGAFSAEVIRGGILSVDQGQLEAAAALGLPKRRQSFRIVLPQAMRAILPTAFNEIIGLAKGTSMVYILALPELFYTIQIIYRRNLEVIPLLMVATVWYLIILSVLSVIQHYVERHYARGAVRTLAPDLLTSLVRTVLPTKWQQGRAAARINAPAAGTDKNAAIAPASAPVSARAITRNALLPGADLPRGGEILIENISKSYGQLKVLNNISLRLPSGSVTAIIGQSGSGKSTLLRTINHLERADSGHVQIDGRYIGYRREGNKLYELPESEILRQRTDTGMVFQSFNLFPHMTVLENIVEAPVTVKGLPKTEARELALALLGRIGLADKAGAYPRQLSGGQQQRVAIARALALKPKVLLFDEPTSALDPELVQEVLDVIKDLAKSGVTLVIVTHEIGFAREVADTVVFMDQGRIIEQGPPALVLSDPQHPRTRDFIAKVL